MKFFCNSSDLQKGINIVEKAISQKTNLPVLENLYLELSNGLLKLRGNDLEIGIEYMMPVERIEKEGAFLIKAKTISSIVSKLPNQMLEFESDENSKAIIKTDKVDFEILGNSINDYPAFPNVENGVRIQLAIKDIINLIKYTIFSVSFDDTKQFLNGILLKIENNKLFFIATDGFRLSLKRSEQAINQPDFSVIIPYKAVSELYKIIQQMDHSTTIEITASSNQCAFSMSNFLLISRIIQGQFPDYKNVMPKSVDNRFTVPRRWLLEASERASIIASHSTNVVRLMFDTNLLNISANSPNMGDFKEDIDVTRLTGNDSIKIAFNVRLILDMIKTLDDDDIAIEFNNEVSPCVFKPVADDDYIYIIMPIRTTDVNKNRTAEYANA